MAAGLVVTGPAVLRSDLIKLENGGEIRGTVESKTGTAGDETVRIETLEGGVVVVKRANLQFVTRRPLEVEQYEVRAKTIPDTVEAHWKLAEWCGRHGLSSQRHSELRRIIELEPDHKQARRGLGHVQYKGEWMTRDEAARARGLVKYKGRYITPQERDILQKSEAEREAEHQWYGRVRLWHNWLTGSSDKRRTKGLHKLQQIRDPNAVPALKNFLAESSHGRVRRLYVGILTRMDGYEPVPPLVAASLHDSDADIRFAARDGISPEQSAVARRLYVKALRDDSNQVVRRAALGLKQVGNEDAVPALIAALNTTHRYRVRVPQPSVSVGTDGAFGGSGSLIPPRIEGLLRTGQLNGVIVLPNRSQARATKVVTVRYEHQNGEVLSALRKLTGRNFGYNERTWRLWWNSQNGGAG